MRRSCRSWFESFLSSQELKSWHRPQVESLVAAEADLLAFETIPSIKEAEALVELLQEFPNTRAWLSLSCKVRSGDSPASRLTPGAVFF